MMITSREDFLMTLLNCGQWDLSLIDGVKYDWCDILESGELHGDISLPSVMAAVFDYGKMQIAKSIEERTCYLESRGETKAEKEELESLRLLSPYEDLEEYHNYIDTHVTCVQNITIYQKYLQEQLEAFADGTGFEVEF